MNRLIIVTVLGLVCTQVAAGQKIDQSMDVDPNSFIDIEHMNGTAVVKGWDKDSVRVTGELNDNAEEFIFRRSGNKVRIEVEFEHSHTSHGDWKKWGGDGDKLVIYVPSQSTINYNSINASISGERLYGGVNVEVINGAVEVSDVRGRIRIESVNGDVDVRSASGDIQVESINGGVDVDHNGNGDVRFESVNGDMKLKSDSQEVRAESVNGDMELMLDKVNDLDLTTVNGNIEVQMHLNDNGEVRISTVGGAVDLFFQKEVSARFDIEGHAGGRFINRLTDDKMQKAKYGPRRWLEFSTGSGAAEVEVSTVNGRVKLDSK